MKNAILRVFALIFFLVGCWYAFSSALVLVSGQGGLGQLATSIAGLWALVGSVGLFKRERWGWRVMVAFFCTATCWSLLQYFVLPPWAGGVPQYSYSLYEAGRAVAARLIPIAVLFWLRSEMETEPRETSKATTLGI
ncbi:MAG: hypothetical protein LAN63_05835 [Acidobacteriia bacterium]|nr:hypothetical protein [Terriglobia bacterium]